MDVPPINPVAFLWITKVIASRLGTLHVLESLYVYSSRQFESIQKVSRHLRHLWRVYNVIIFEFLYHFVIFTGLATARVLDCVKPLNFLLEYLVGQNFVRQNCKNFVLVSKILSDEIFCPSKILSNEILSDKVYLKLFIFYSYFKYLLLVQYFDRKIVILWAPPFKNRP